MVGCLVGCCATLMIETTSISETSVNLYKTTRRNTHRTAILVPKLANNPLSSTKVRNEHENVGDDSRRSGRVSSPVLPDHKRQPPFSFRSHIVPLPLGADYNIHWLLTERRSREGRRPALPCTLSSGFLCLNSILYNPLATRPTFFHIHHSFTLEARLLEIWSRIFHLYRMLFPHINKYRKYYRRLWHSTVLSGKKFWLCDARSQKIGQKRSIKTVNWSFEDVAKFQYLRTTLTEENYVQEEIKSRLNSGNACYHSVRVFCRPACCLGM
jgi:hypothetical protein